jgi:hypothetical protein
VIFMEQKCGRTLSKSARFWRLRQGEFRHRINSSLARNFHPLGFAHLCRPSPVDSIPARLKNHRSGTLKPRCRGTADDFCARRLT